MADNIDVDPGTSGSKQPVATDDCGAAGHFQRIKLDVGTDGVSSPVTSATGMPIPVATVGGSDSVASSATNVTLIAANTSRKGFTIYNDSTAILYVKFGATASATSFHVKMAAGDYYESPAGVNYTGIVDGIWDAADGNARIGEFT